MKYADMHCDTLTELYLHGFDIAAAPLHISLDGAAGICPYVQSAAIWTDKKLDDNAAYDRFWDVLHHFEASDSVKCGKIKLCRNSADARAAAAEGLPAFMLSIEGARLLGSDTLDEHFHAVADAGVWLITLQWSGTDCIGGAWNTDGGLTDAGIRLLHLMAERGIVCDLSHASDTETDEVLSHAEALGLRVCASHSNSRAVCAHRRNLTDAQFAKIRGMNGVVGLSMAPEHLAESGSAGIDDIRRHLEHYLELGGEDTVVLGCDFDGISSTPAGVGGIRDIPHLRDTLARDYPPELIYRLFFGNAARFMGIDHSSD